LEAIFEELEKQARINNTTQVYKCVNRLTKQACPRVKLIQCETVEMLTEDAPILDRWRKYCENLYSAPEDERAPDSTPVSETSEGAAERLRWDRTKPVPSVEKIEKALKFLRPDKAVGPD